MTRYWRAELRRDADRLYAAAAALKRAVGDVHDLADRLCIEARRKELCDQARRLETKASVGRGRG